MIRITRWFLFLFVFSLPILPEEFGLRSATLPDVSVIRLIIMLLFLSFIVTLLLDRDVANRLKKIFRNYSWLVVLVIVYFFWVLLASFNAPVGRVAVFGAIRDILYFLVPYLVAVTCLSDGKDVLKIAWLVGVSGTLSAIIGVFEYFTGFRLFKIFTNSDSAWNVFDLEKGGEFVGVLSSFPHPLAFGSFLVVSLVFLYLLSLHVGSSKKITIYAMMVLCLMGVVASTSRGAVASLLVCLFFYFILIIFNKYKKIKRDQRILAMLFIIIPLFIFISVATLFIGYGLAKGKSEREYGSSMIRVLQLQRSVAPVKQRPLLGYGVGEAAETLGMKSLTVDNYYLTVTLESGLVGFVLFILVLSIYTIRAAQAYQKIRQPIYLALGMLMAAMSTQLLILSLKQTLPLLFLSCALLLVTISSSNEQKGVKLKMISPRSIA